MKIDDRLSRAGEAFRAQPVDVAEVSTTAMTAKGVAASDTGPIATSRTRATRMVRHRRSVLLPVLGSLVAAAVVVVAVILDVTRHSATHSPVVSSMPDRLVGTEWTLHAITVADASVPVSPRTPADRVDLSFPTMTTVQFDDGCNSGGGTVDIEAASITFGQLGSTDMSCAAVNPSSTPTQTEAIHTVITGGVTSWSIDRDLGLHLTRATTELVYRAVVPTRPTPIGAVSSPTHTALLVGHRWRLVSVTVDGHELPVVDSPGATPPELSFPTKTTMQFDDGCNVQAGQVAIDAKTITIGQVGTNLQACGYPTPSSPAAIRDILAVAGRTFWSVDEALHLTRADAELVYAPVVDPSDR